MNEHQPMPRKSRDTPAGWSGLLRVIRLAFLLPACFFQCLAAEDPATAPGSLHPVDMQVEYGTNPLALDTSRPRFTWRFHSTRRSALQSGYQIRLASTEEGVRSGAADLWDTGRVRSDRSLLVPYNGRTLASRMRCWWQVRVWDQDGGASKWSDPAWFETGRLREEDWSAKWIASDLELQKYQQELRALPDHDLEPESSMWKRATEIRKMTSGIDEAPAVYLRKEFELDAPVRRAVAHFCGLGLAELHLNGHRAGDRQLDPAYTDYAKRVLYVSHDVSSMLQPGRNTVGVLLGNGWFNMITPHLLRFYTADYIAPPQLRLELDIEMQDGTRRLITSDSTWRATTDGPIRFNSLLGGETYDARRELTGWSRSGYDDASWKPAKLAPSPQGKLAAQQLAPVRRTREIPAVSVNRKGDAWRFDLGVETTGWARLRLRGQPGQKITIRYPGADSHTLGRYQTCHYICSGNGPEVFEPRFCYNGFRYVDVVGLTDEPAPGDVVGQMVVSDLASAGSFKCSDDRLNQLQDVLLRTIRNYIVHIPNDPTREKAGWTQDMETGFLLTAYNFHSAAMYVKWQRDFLDAMLENGYMPPVAPGRFDGPTINGPWWGGAVIYAPWYMYGFYGDSDILEESYPSMQRYFGWLETQANQHIISWGLGDWMEVGSVRPKRTPVALTSTCAYYWFATIMAETARMTERTGDARRYEQLAREIRDAYNRTFFDPATGDYGGGSQTAQLLSLQFGLVPENERERVRLRLADRIARDDSHLTTGFVGTPYLLTGLSEQHLPELAWAVATQTSYPGFIDAVITRGNSVMKENWDGGLVQMPSLQGPIGAWFYHSLAGIRQDPQVPGFKRIILKPELAGGLSWVEAHHDGPYGRIASHWKREGNQFTWHIEIPPNSSALVHVPARNESDVLEDGRPATRTTGLTFLAMQQHRAVFEVGSGRYTFTSVLPP